MIKKNPDGNEYLFAENIWIRNYNKPNDVPSIQINNLFEKEDYSLILKNEINNRKFPKISEETLIFKKIIIISDGYGFEKKHEIIKKLPKDICILAINKSLKKWNLISNQIDSRTINAYVINNPYENSIDLLPDKKTKYYPTCISSIKTNLQFTNKYKGDIYTYSSSYQENFGYKNNEKYVIDDYRNPVCACISLAHKFKVKKLMMFCCDDSFEDKRVDSTKLDNGLYSYSPLIKSQKIIDANLFWLSNQEDEEDEKIQIADYSSGIEYENANYIKNEEQLIEFFEEDI